MEKGVIEEIKKIVLQGCEIKEIDGNKYSPVGLNRVYSDPRPEALNIRSLSGIVKYLKDNKDKYSLDDLTIVVIDHKSVNVVTSVHGESNERHVILRASLEDIKSFPYERFLEHEDFLIKMRSLFANNDDRNNLIMFASKVSNDTSFKTEDDGISQVVEVKRGISGALTDEKPAPSIVKLKPFRTFSECEQPESEFLFRMKDDRGVVCTLLEADGGFWKQEARIKIKEYLELNIPEVSVIA